MDNPRASGPAGPFPPCRADLSWQGYPAAYLLRAQEPSQADGLIPRSDRPVLHGVAAQSPRRRAVQIGG